MKILETSRLQLRHLEPADLDDLFALYGDPEVRRTIPDAPRTLAEARTELEWFRHGHPRRPELGLWATIYKPTNQFIGRCGLLPWTIDGQDEVEVAYTIAPSHWGQGLATEAARAILAYGFDQLGLTRLICLIDKENAASIRVAEKIGMVFEKEGRDEIGPFLLYARNRPVAPGSAPDVHFTGGGGRTPRQLGGLTDLLVGRLAGLAAAGDRNWLAGGVSCCWGKGYTTCRP